MRGKKTIGQRRDAGTAGQKLKENNEQIVVLADKLHWLLDKMDVNASVPFRLYFTIAKFGEMKRGYGGVGATQYVLGELYATLNIGLRGLGFATYSEFEQAYQRRS